LKNRGHWFTTRRHQDRTQPSLLDAPLQAVKKAPELWRSVTAEEEALLSEALPQAGCTLPVGKEVYGALVRIGMRKKHRPLRPSDWFEASRAELVKELGEHCQERQLGSYLRVLREGGLLARRRRRQGSNLWRLPTTEPRQGRQPIADQRIKNGNPLPIKPATVGNGLPTLQRRTAERTSTSFGCQGLLCRHARNGKRGGQASGGPRFTD
jgi:hypothetical protein